MTPIPSIAVAVPAAASDRAIGRAAAWLLVQRPWIVPIPGTTKHHRLQENIGAATVELTAADLAEIERAAAAIQVEGDRYPRQLQAMIGR